MAVLYGKNYGKPTLDLNFARNKSLVDTTTEKNYVTFSRAQSGNEATYIGSDGLIKYAAADEARFDHDPATLQSLGLLIEESRTNYFTNSTPTSTTWAQYNGSSITDNQATGPNGVTNSASLVTFPATGGAIPIIGGQGTGVSGTATVSMYVRAVTGTVSLQIGTNLAYGTTQIVGTSWTRIQFTTASIGTSAGLRSGDVNSVQNFYVFGGQIEAGVFPTSYIPTSGQVGGVTRAADMADITGTDFSSWYNPTAGSFYVQESSRNNSLDKFYIFISNGANNDRLWLSKDSVNRHIFRVYDSTNTLQVVSTSAILPSSSGLVSSKFVGSYLSGDSNSVLNGILSGASANNAFIRSGSNSAYLGRSGGGGYLNGHISRLTYYPKRLPDIELQQLTK